MTIREFDTIGTSFMTRIFNFLLLAALLVSTSSHALDLPQNDAASRFGETQSEPEFLKVDEAFVFSEQIVDGGLQLNWQIADDYYLYKERFKFQSTNPEATLGEPKFSKDGKKKQDPYFGEVHVIYHDLSVFLPVSLSGAIQDAEIKVTYQGCAEAGLCYPPTRKKVMFVPPESNVPAATESAQAVSNSETASFDNSAATTQLANTSSLDDAAGVFSFLQDSSLAAIIGIFFLLGLGLTFTPCVFPMIPIITSIIAGQEKPTFGKSLTLSVTYVLGMAITYAAAGVVTGLLGAGANVQAALQDPWLLSIFALIFIALSLAMFGFYELQLPAFMRDRLNAKSQNLSGGHIGSVFMIGALSALVVSPCVSAPLAGALLYISSTADAVIGGASLFALGLGMGVPLILIAVGGGQLLPKAGQWMNAVKAAFGVMLLAVAIWLVGRFAPPALTMVLWAGLLGISATQLGAFDSAEPGWPRTFKGLGLMMAFYAALLLIGAATGAKDPLRPLENASVMTPVSGSNVKGTTQVNPFIVIQDLPGLEKELKNAQALGKPLMVDMYADWCISCIIMENEVFPLPEIAQRLNQFHLVKADLTPNSAANQALLDHFGLFGPPSFLFFKADGEELKPLRIVGELSTPAFQARLDQALAQP